MGKASMIEKLKGTERKPVVLVDRQSIGDIINAIVDKHKECAPDYDLIADEFDKGKDLYDTCEDIWQFCKSNLAYSEESEKKQYTSCPLTILTAKDVDCKNYALFVGGVLDALKRRGYNLTWRFRFASYEIDEPRPGHVFVVVNENTDNIWIDPVLDQFNQHLFYWYKRDRRPTVSAIGRITQARVGNAAGDQLQQQLIEYSEGVTGAYNQGVQTNTVNMITQSVLQGAAMSVPQIAAAVQVLKAGQATINNSFGVGSAAARVYSDLTSLNVVGLFNDLFNGRTYQYQIYWLAAMYHFYVLGQANITNQNQMTDADVWPAVKWFIDRTGVYLSGTELLQALTISTDKYLSYYGVNKGITTDRARIDAAVAVAKKYWSGPPINPGDAPGNFAPGTAGTWANTVGVFDLGIAQIANTYGLTPEQYVKQTGLDYTQMQGGSVSEIIPGVSNMWLIAGFGALILVDLLTSHYGSKRA